MNQILTLSRMASLSAIPPRFDHMPSFELPERRFLDMCKRVLGQDGIERVNRAYCNAHGFDPSREAFLKQRINLADEALHHAGFKYGGYSYIIDVEQSGAVTVTFTDDESWAHFKLAWL